MRYISHLEESMWDHYSEHQKYTYEKGTLWIKQREEEKKRHFAALFEQKKEMKDRVKNYQQNTSCGNISSKNSINWSDKFSEKESETEIIEEKKESNTVNDVDDNQSETTKSKTVIETIVALRSPSPFNGKCRFILSTEGFVLADEKGMENPSLPWSNRMVLLKIYSKENDIITDWRWEYVED